VPYRFNVCLSFTQRLMLSVPRCMCSFAGRNEPAEAMASLHHGYAGVPDFLKISWKRPMTWPRHKPRDQGRGEWWLRMAYPRSRCCKRTSHLQVCYGTADLGLVAYESSPTSGLIEMRMWWWRSCVPGLGSRLPPVRAGVGSGAPAHP
jgi:hypothetical protein